MTCIIVDDNELAIETLEELLKLFCDQVIVVGKAQSIKSAVSLINELKPEIVFLDVEMNNESGFDLFPHFPKPNFLVVFTTSHEQYALKAFKTDCFDYLLKPIDPEELTNSIRKIEQEKQALAKKTQIDYKNTKLNDSIDYAKRIQNSILVAEHEIKKHIPELFILYKPKDIVSGDFYWFATLENNGEFIIVAADCTGHGVPGAFLSMIGSTLLNEIVNQKKINEPIKIIHELVKGVSSTLINKIDGTEHDDGMDISVCRINKELKKVSFAGANHNLFVVNNKELIKLDSQINSFNGIFGFKEGQIQVSQELILQKDTMVYLSTDGYFDQIGEKNRKKFQTSDFEKLLQEICILPIQEQKNILEVRFCEWKGSMEQTDDVLIIGFRF